MIRYVLMVLGWVFMTLGVFSIVSPLLPKYSVAQEEANHVLYVLLGIGLVTLGGLMVRAFRERR